MIPPPQYHPAYLFCSTSLLCLSFFGTLFSLPVFKTLSSPFELFNVEVRRGGVVLLVKPGPVCSTQSTETFSFPTIRSTTSHITASTKGVSSPSDCLPLPLFPLAYMFTQYNPSVSLMQIQT